MVVTHSSLSDSQSLLEDALSRLHAVMHESRRVDRELRYCLKSRAGFVRLHGNHPADPAHAAILVGLDERIARLRGAS